MGGGGLKKGCCFFSLLFFIFAASFQRESQKGPRKSFFLLGLSRSRFRDDDGVVVLAKSPGFPFYPTTRREASFSSDVDFPSSSSRRAPRVWVRRLGVALLFSPAPMLDARAKLRMNRRRTIESRFDRHLALSFIALITKATRFLSSKKKREQHHNEKEDDATKRHARLGSQRSSRPRTALVTPRRWSTTGCCRRTSGWRAEKRAAAARTFSFFLSSFFFRFFVRNFFVRNFKVLFIIDDVGRRRKNNRRKQKKKRLSLLTHLGSPYMLTFEMFGILSSLSFTH